MPHPKRNLPTGTVTFLFSDIEGSTRLAHELDPATYRALLEQHHRLLRSAFAAHGGVERGTQGDAFLVIFRDARSAVGAAVEAQRSLAGTSWPKDLEVRVRMGLHSGEGIPGGDDYVGLDVNRAARIASAGHGGQLLISDATRALAERDLPEGVSIRDLGRHRLKDLDQPEHLFQLVADGLPADFPTLRTAEPRPGNMPVRLTSFIGRERELDELERLLAEVRLLTLTGPGGTGKTSLAVELARRVQERFPDGAWFVPLESVSDPDLVASAVVGAVPLAQPGQRSPEQRLVDDLAEQRVIIVLDNFEQVVEAGSLVSRLLRACPNLQFVVTSRAVLRLMGEQEYQVPPLPVHGEAGASAVVTFEPVPAAVRLFAERARAVDANFSITDDNRSAVEQICARLDGLPLGIELAAARVNLLPPRAILERLDRQLPLPGRATRDLPERQRTLEATIGWSYDLLDDAHRRLLRRMSVFVGGCRIEEAEKVCGPAEELGIDPLDGLVDLVDQSLIRREASDEPRLSILETVRAFARDRLAEDPEQNAIARRHRAAYRDLVESAAPHLTKSDQRQWYQLLDREIDNIRAAIRNSIDSAEPNDGLRMAGGAWRHWVRRGYLHEGEELVSSLLGISQNTDDASRTLGLIARGSLRYWIGSLAPADHDYREAVDTARTGAPDLLALALFNLAFMRMVQPEGQAVLQEAVTALTQRGDAQSLAYAAWLRVTIAQIHQDPDGVKVWALAALGSFREIDDVLYTGMCLGSLMFSVLRSPTPAPEDLRQGLAWGFESLRLYHSVGDVGGTVVTLFGSARLLASAGEIGAALRARAAAEAVAERHRVQIPPQFIFQLGGPPQDDARAQSMSEQEIEQHIAAGRQMSLTETTEQVLQLEETLLRVLEDDATRARAVKAFGGFS